MTECRVPLQRLAEIRASGLQGEALQDAMYQEYFGHPAQKDSLEARRQAAWQLFLALSDDMTEEERNDGFMNRSAFADLRLGLPDDSQDSAA